MSTFNKPPFTPETALIQPGRLYTYVVTLVNGEQEKVYTCPNRNTAAQFIKANGLSVDQVEFFGFEDAAIDQIKRWF